LRVAEQTVSGSIKASSEKELLQALAEILELDITHQNNKVIISGKDY
jgi:ferric-dicitrate binding protein FerR (iron transport regulator)